MNKILTYKGAVMTWECDSNDHMNVMYYINKFEHAGRNFDLELGLNTEGRRSNIGVVVLEQNIKYVKEVFADDLLYIKSGLISISNKAITLEHDMCNSRSDELVARMRIVLVSFDKIERKALQFPIVKRRELLKKWNLKYS